MLPDNNQAAWEWSRSSSFSSSSFMASTGSLVSQINIHNGTNMEQTVTWQKRVTMKMHWQENEKVKWNIKTKIWHDDVIDPPVRIRGRVHEPEPEPFNNRPVTPPFTLLSYVCNVCVCVFRGKLAEDSVDPLSRQRRSEETHPTQTVQVITCCHRHYYYIM